MRRFPLLSHAGDDPNTIAEMIRVRAGAKAPRTADGKPDALGPLLPAGPIVTGPYLVKLVQTPLLVMILEDFVAGDRHDGLQRQRMNQHLSRVTERLHLTERYHRDLAHLEIETTIDDPGTFK